MSESDGMLELGGGGGGDGGPDGEGGDGGTGGGVGGVEGGVGAVGGAGLCPDPLPFLKKKIATATTTIIATIQIIKVIFFGNKNLLKRP